MEVLKECLGEIIVVYYLRRKNEKKDKGKLVLVAKNGLVIMPDENAADVIGFNKVYLITNERGKEIYSVELNNETGRAICFSDLILEDRETGNEFLPWQKKMERYDKKMKDRQLSLLGKIEEQLSSSQLLEKEKSERIAEAKERLKS